MPFYNHDNSPWRFLCEEKLIEIYDEKFHASIINDEIMLITSEDVKCVCDVRKAMLRKREFLMFERF